MEIQKYSNLSSIQTPLLNNREPSNCLNAVVCTTFACTALCFFGGLVSIPVAIGSSGQCDGCLSNRDVKIVCIVGSTLLLFAVCKIFILYKACVRGNPSNEA